MLNIKQVVTRFVKKIQKNSSQIWTRNFKNCTLTVRYISRHPHFLMACVMVDVFHRVLFSKSNY